MVRKWIVISALAIVGVSVLVFVLSQPKKGSVEWWKKRCLQLHAEQHQETLRWKVAHLCERLTGVELIRSDDKKLDEVNRELERGLNKLLELEFLTRLEYAFTNIPPWGSTEGSVRVEIEKLLISAPHDRRVFTWIDRGAEVDPSVCAVATFWLIVPREDVARWERVLGKPTRTLNDATLPMAPTGHMRGEADSYPPPPTPLGE